MSATRAASGAQLTEAKECQIATEEMPPSYYFASKGTILPAKQNGGLPVVTVNVPEVDVQFLRVEPAQLPRFIEMVIGNRPKPADEDSNDGEYAAGDRATFFLHILIRDDIDKLARYNDNFTDCLAVRVSLDLR